MAATRKALTPAAVEQIATLGKYKVPVMEICRMTGYSNSSVYRVLNGTYEQHRDKEKQMREKSKAAEARPAPQPEPSPAMTDERTLQRIADSADYTNALLNGVINKLDQLLQVWQGGVTPSARPNSVAALHGDA